LYLRLIVEAVFSTSLVFYSDSQKYKNELNYTQTKKDKRVLH